ncbi:endonuclease/exonuclease/phosphatase family protein [Proteus mirabilis]|uniref:endonuclease/exonuclease/phosphatase family protein n=1 Tax=Proteus mirabilis TaxID=584 RepID=UPI0038C71A68
MTVSTELSHEEYVGNGVTTDFDFRFRIFEGKHLIVVVADSDGNENTLKNGTDYTIVGAGSYHGGKVVLNKPLAQGWKILLERDLPVVQETDLRNQGKFFAEVHEDAFDYLTMLIQKALGTFSLSLRKPTYLSNYYDAKGNRIANLAPPKLGADAVNKDYVDNSIKDIDSKTLRVKDKPINALPNTEQRANKILAFDDNGQPITVLPESGSASDVLIELAKPEGAKLIGFGNNHTVNDLNSVIRNEVDSYYLPTPFYLSNKETLNNTLKIATFNTWVDGSVKEYYGGDYTSKIRLMDLYYELIKSECDFIGMQECYIFPQNPASDFIIKPFKDAFFGYANYIGREWFYGNLSVSRLPFKEKRNVVYAVTPNNVDKEHRAYTRVVIEKNGVDISIYNTHLSLDWYLAELMRDELIQAIQSDINSHIIVMADFNRDDAAFFAPFIGAGFVRGNNEQYNTNNHDGSWFIDEILYKGFSSKLAADIQETPYKLSDHKLFYVELSL